MIGNLLVTLIVLPLAGAAAVACLPRRSTETIRTVSLLASLSVLGLALAALAGMVRDADGLAYRIRMHWLGDASLPARFELGVDGLSMMLILLTALLVPLVILGSWGPIARHAAGFHVCLLALESMLIGTFAALDLLLFFCFWEASLIPMLFLIGVWGGPRRIHAAFKFLIYTAAGSLLMLVALLYTAGFTVPGQMTFDLVELAERVPVHLAGDVRTQTLLFGAFALAFAIKIPLIPLHTWLPDAHVEAPTGGSVLLAGVLLKMGIYGFVRIAIPLFPEGAAAIVPGLLGLSAAGVVYGGWMAFAQSDMKKLIAYSSVSHLGVAGIGIFCGDALARQGALFSLVAHGASTGALFFLVGMIHDRTHSRAISDHGGLAARAPILSAAFLIVTMAAIGLPGLSGFWGEILVIWGTASAGYLGAAACAAAGVLLAALYMLNLVRQILFGPFHAPTGTKVDDLTPREVIVCAPLVGLVLLMGILPMLFFERIDTAAPFDPEEREPAVTDVREPGR